MLSSDRCTLTSSVRCLFQSSPGRKVTASSVRFNDAAEERSLATLSSKD